MRIFLHLSSNLSEKSLLDKEAAFSKSSVGFFERRRAGQKVPPLSRTSSFQSSDEDKIVDGSQPGGSNNRRRVTKGNAVNLATWRGHDAEICSLQVKSGCDVDGPSILTAASDGTAALWSYCESTASFQCTASFIHPKSAAFFKNLCHTMPQNASFSGASPDSPWRIGLHITHPFLSQSREAVKSP